LIGDEQSNIPIEATWTAINEKQTKNVSYSTFGIGKQTFEFSAPSIKVTPRELTLRQGDQMTSTVSNANKISFYQQREPENLFADISLAKISLTKEEEQRVAVYATLPSTVDLRIVAIKIEALKSNKIFKLNLATGKTYLATIQEIVERSQDDFTLLGKIDSENGFFTLVVRDRRVLGSIRIGRNVFSIIPLRDGICVLRRIDPSKMPRPDPPEFGSEKKEEHELSFEEETGGYVDLDVANSTPTIKVLVAYTPAAAQAIGEPNMRSLVQLDVDETNQSYRNSNVNLRLELAYIQQVNYTESSSFATDLNRFQSSNDGFMDEIHNIRNTYFADVAVLVTDVTQRSVLKPSQLAVVFSDA
jgi:hypothetical protein